MKTALTELSKTREKLTARYKVLSTKKDEQNQLNQRLNNLKEVSQWREQGVELKQAFQAAEQTLDKARAEWQSAKSTYFSQLSVVLAGELEEGKPCPVCGSTGTSYKSTGQVGRHNKRTGRYIEKKKETAEKTFNRFSDSVRTSLTSSD